MPELIEFPKRPTDTELLAHKLTTVPLKRCSPLTKVSHCVLCGFAITKGQMYRNGGLRLRAHDECAQKIAAAVQQAAEA